MHENDITMHENDITMHENDNSMRENENIVPKCFMEIFWAKVLFSCMEISFSCIKYLSFSCL